MKKHFSFILLGIMMLGVVMRAPFTALPAVLTDIASGLGVEVSSLGILTSIPLIMFALCSSIAPRMAAKFGLERLMAIVLVIMVIGSGLRVFNLQTLFIGTMMIGASIAFINVLLPSLVAANFPLHMDTKTMNCHYCGFQKGIPQTCPNCQSRSIRYYGTGTQKAYDELQEILPEARILRMDVDTTKKKGAHEDLLERFGRGKADILLGTQMIAKGLDFPNVTLVGVLNADTALNLPDFRSSERTFQLLTQVAGRAGRADKEGEVLIQTYNPNHYAITFAKEQDYEGFYRYEMGIRKNLGYPPYYFTVGLTFSHKSEEFVVKKAYETVAFLRQHLKDAIQILGPTPKPIARTHNLYHYQIILKYRHEDRLEEVLNQILDWTQERENQDLRLIIDNEPQNMM